MVLTLVSAASYAKAPSQITTALHPARQQRASVYLVRPEHPLNPAVFDLRGPDVRILPELRWLSALLRRRWDAVVRRGDTTALATLDTSASIAHGPVVVRFHTAAETSARTRARALGIPDGARIVTLHVREGGFKGSIGQAERGKDEIRN